MTAHVGCARLRVPASAIRDTFMIHTGVVKTSSLCQTTRAASVALIRRRRPNGRHTRGSAASLTRRRFMTTAASAIAAVGGIAKPYLSQAADRPLVTHGIQSGDVSI